MQTKNLIPLVVRPKLLATKNRWRTNGGLKTQLGRDIMLTCVSAIVVVTLYQACYTGLTKIQSQVHAAYLPPLIPLGLVMLVLMGMLIISNLVAALGALFLGRDLDLVLAAPISPFKFFVGKLSEIVLTSSWVVMIFGLPAILALARAYHATWSFYPLLVVTILPYFLIPAALAIILVNLFATIIPANRTREVMLLVGGLCLVAMYFMLQLIYGSKSTPNSINEILQLVRVVSIPNTIWVPSYWAANSLAEGLLPTGKGTATYLTLLYSSAVSVSALAYICQRCLHLRAYSKSKNNRRGIRLKSRAAQARLVRLLPMLQPQVRALVAKEIKVFSRDMTQAIQLVLLLILCMLYLYNFRVLQAVQGLPEATRIWWQGFLTISNIAMGAFVTTAISTRFVFPSMSLEGQSYWILQTAPISMAQVLRSKFACWYFPVGTISSVIFAAGGFAINAEPRVILINIISSWIICIGIVGLATGLGAYFANFDWESPSQLAASFGSLVFMMISTILITINILPVSMIIFLRTLRVFGQDFPSWQWNICLATTFALLAYINFVTARWAMRLGENSLMARQGR